MAEERVPRVLVTNHVPPVALEELREHNFEIYYRDEETPMP